MPVAALLSIGAPTASVFPSPLTEMAWPKWSSSPGFEALTYATCFNVDARAEERAGACAAAWTVRPATASHSGHTLETFLIRLPLGLRRGLRAWPRFPPLTRIVTLVDLLAGRVCHPGFFRQCHVGRSVLETTPLHADRVAGLDDLLAPAPASQLHRRAELTAPLHDLSALVLDVEHERRMRIDHHNLRDGSRHGRELVLVTPRIPMVREQQCRRHHEAGDKE